MNNYELAKKYFLDGCALIEAANFVEAEKMFMHSLELVPNRASTLTNLSVAQLKLKKYFEAKSTALKAISIEGHNSEAYLNLGVIEKELRHYEVAIKFFDKAISLKSNYYEAWSNKGNVLNALKRFDEAMDHYDKALSFDPKYYEAWANRGVALHDQRRYVEAIVNYDKALSLRPNYAEAWSNKGGTLNSLKRHSESAKCYRKALEHTTEDSYLLGQVHHQMMLGCDWIDYDKYTNDIFQLVRQGCKGAEPFGFQGIASSEDLLKRCAENFSKNQFPNQSNLTKISKYKHKKIHIGYLCGEFRNQATSILMARVWELHDKANFEIFAFDNGWDDGSEYRQRIERAFTKIINISNLNDLNVVKLIEENEIDILINLNGFFGEARQQVFSYRPAPIQVNYLGFPGTIGAKYIDYIIADRLVIPEESKIHYIENIAFLPNCYQANDDRRKISDKNFSRKELGLPDGVFVFACFNNNYKITPSVFDSWMKILLAVHGSVLWLIADNPDAKNNLIKEAAIRGISSSRLIFAERLSLPEHLARHRQADLFLDTLPYNAHTTCSDALWAGLPVLTLKGRTFPGRVAASLLTAVGLSELITNTSEEYEALAIELALNSKKLSAIKEKLATNRLNAPLFDSKLFTKNLEAIYIEMYKRYQAGLGPEDIYIQ